MPRKWLFSLLLLFLSAVSVSSSAYVFGLPRYGSAQAIVTGQGCPVGIDVDRSDSLYWADFCSGQILELRKGTQSPVVVLSGLNGPQGVGVDAAGNLFYDEYYAGTLSELPAHSSTPKVLATGLDYPNFMSVDARGDVYFITGQTAGDKIVRFDIRTTKLTTLVTAPQPHDTNHGFSGVFISPAGDLYYTMIGYDTIYRLPARSSTPVVVRTASHPNDVAVDNAGRLRFLVALVTV